MDITTRKPLVGHIKESKMALLLHHFRDLAPLVLRRVHARRVMCTGMQQEDTLVRRTLHVLQQALKVEPDGVLVVVSVLFDGEACILEDGCVVGPAGRGDVDGLGVRVEALQEGGGDAQGSRARDGLGDGDAVLGDERAGGSVGEFGGRGSEGRDAGDAGVFLVEAGGDDLGLGGLDGRQDVWLSLVIPCILSIYIL